MMKSFNTFHHRVAAKALLAASALVCALAGALPSTDAAAPARAATELPATWQGEPVRPLALSVVEQRFAERFPGHIARLTDGRQIVVVRDVAVPTRMLHPAADCYRGLGYRIEGERLESMVPPRSAASHAALPPKGAVARLGSGPAAGLVPPRSAASHAALPPEGAVARFGSGPAAGGATQRDQAAVQRCFTARKGGTALRVCEQIEDAQGQRFADTSAWYWAAVTGRSAGPWRAVTVTRPLTDGLI
ncbi:hypothetical protein [Ottowia testudinis]|uniref:Uncharacterized protein n=1 Tax=Ottowia testudinis TaxID=2816950 RepID=A0A975CJT0_9BURK|nr:hypothetical protein [Ottowia testudinis]QTD45479.1 hypothetical protein J1M35_00690 [Ottowia testudinis]